MDPRELFEANLSLIDRICGRVAARAGLTGADAEDFASEARLALLERDCAILREWEGRAALGTFLTIVIQRVMADWRRKETGKWRPSAEARRMGDAAVLLERLLRRNGRTVDEALAAVRSVDPALTREATVAMAERLPPRAPQVRVVAIDEELDVPSARDAADTRVVESEARHLAQRTSSVVRSAIDSMPLEDRMILGFRFASGLTIASISRMLRLPQRPLYRRIEALVARLRAALQEARIDPTAVDELIGSPITAMNFGSWKNQLAGPANESVTGPDAAGERWP